MVNDAVSDARAADPGRAVTAQIEKPVTISGDDLRLRQAVANLVRNALVHTPAGSPVEVALPGGRPGVPRSTSSTTVPACPPSSANASSSGFTVPTRREAAIRAAVGWA